MSNSVTPDAMSNERLTMKAKLKRLARVFHTPRQAAITERLREPVPLPPPSVPARERGNV